MNLDEAQKQKVASWLEEGLKLSEIQKKLASEFGLSLTYMEMRFLLDDLKLKPKEKEVPRAPAAELGGKSVAAAKTPPKGGGPLPPEEQLDELEEEEEELPAGMGNVSVSVDRVTRPGALVSGNVTFSDGKSAQWHLDQLGRLGMVPKEQGYRPSQTDLMGFQAQLQKELAKLGY